MANVVPPDVPMSGDGLESWVDGTVTFTARSPEAMPAELSDYLELGAHIAEWLPDSSYVLLAIEPDWDGCGGRWLNIELHANGYWIARLCAVEAFAATAPAEVVHRTLAILDADRWELSVDGDSEEPWGYWALELATQPASGGQVALRPALSLFDTLEPHRWFVSMRLVPGYDAEGNPTTPSVAQGPTSVDLRAWRKSVGLAPPPPTIAPRGTKPWANLCEAGLHHLHAPPCWNRS